MKVGTRIIYNNDGTDYLGVVCTFDEVLVAHNILQDGTTKIASGYVPVRLDHQLFSNNNQRYWSMIASDIIPVPLTVRIEGNELILEEQL